MEERRVARIEVMFRMNDEEGAGWMKLRKRVDVRLNVNVEYVG